MSDAEQPHEPHDAVPVLSQAPLYAAIAGAAAVALGALGVLAGDGPYLSFDEVNWWIVLFAIGVFAMLFAAPFALQAKTFAHIRESERRWERAVLAWAGVTAAAGALFAALAAAGGFDTGSAAGALGITGLAESAIVLGVVAMTMLEG